jgi:dTDP-4-dehydrorhamnose 3,5-epimerase
MRFTESKIKGLWFAELEPRMDERGYFVRDFAKEELAAIGIKYDILHGDRSFNKVKGTTRGLHYQIPPKAEGKIMQCLRGRFYCVAVDIRKGSATYGEWVSIELAPDKFNMIICPKGCVNGIQVLEDNSELQYFMSEVYSGEHARGFRWNDPFFDIEWPFKTPTVISDKDANWPLIDKKNPPAIEL